MRDAMEAGRRLFQSAENLRRSADDLDALLESLWELLSERKVDLGEVEHAGYENGGGKDQWLATGFASNMTVMESISERPAGARGRPRRPRPRGTVTFLVRLCGAEDVQEPRPNWPWLDQACLIVGWHKGANNDDLWEIAHFEPSQGEGFIRSVGGKVWAWHVDGEDYSNFFVLPIFALRNENDLKKHVLGPLKALFEGGDIETAFPFDSPALGAGGA